MATIDKKNESAISDEAYELIGCFYDGVDEIVYSLAKETAQQRNPQQKPILIEVEDVRKAGELVIESLKQLFRDKEVPAHVRDKIESMGDCFEQSN